MGPIATCKIKFQFNKYQKQLNSFESRGKFLFDKLITGNPEKALYARNVLFIN